MAKTQSDNPSSIMERLLASQPTKSLKLTRNQKIEGTVILKTDKELVLDIGSKAEGTLPVKDLSEGQKSSIKAGDKLEAYVVLPENESGQATLSLYQATGISGSQKSKGISLAKFQNALNKKSRLQGKVLEINKGGLIVDVGGVRGFLPNSQVGFELLSSLKVGLENLIGQVINITVTEIDATNNRLIFSQRGQVSDEVLAKLKEFKKDQNISGHIVAVLPFGLVIDLNGLEGLVFISDISWEKIENIESKFQIGQEVQAQVVGIDEELGRLNLSMKHLTEDPFSKIAEKYPADEVIKTEVLNFSDDGVVFKLEDGLEGFLPASKMGSEEFNVGKAVTLLVDSVDKKKRRVNLAPFVTSTEGLIYK